MNGRRNGSGNYGSDWASIKIRLVFDEIDLSTYNSSQSLGHLSWRHLLLGGDTHSLPIDASKQREKSLLASTKSLAPPHL